MLIQYQEPMKTQEYMEEGLLSPHESLILKLFYCRYSAGSTITATVNITANHMGRFYFHLCPLASKDQLETEACFEAHPVKLANGEPHYTLTSHSPGFYDVDLTLPSDVRCAQCVLRWTYVVGK
ncbi:hypothetical protein C0J52_20992 [Blattella germanica]|nr:hypothetical protein C0J52_20992 [Blattella germanica]